MGEDRYVTSDFYTTAVLILNGFEVLEVTSHGPTLKVKRFHFKDTEKLQKVIMDYMNGKLEGNIRAFRNSIETVKDMVHSG